MKKLIEWAAYAFVVYMAMKAGIFWVALIFFEYLIYKFLIRWAVGPTHRSPADYPPNEIETEKIKKLSQKAQPNKLEKLTSNHTFGRRELTFNFKTYFVYENDGYRIEEKLTEEEKLERRKRSREIYKRKAVQERRKRERAEFVKQRDLVLFAQMLKESHEYGPLNNPEDFEIVEIPNIGYVYRKV